MRGNRDWKAIIDLAEDVDTRLSEDQKSAARRIVAANAAGASLADQVADATELMMALGIAPGQVDDDSFRDIPALHAVHR